MMRCVILANVNDTMDDIMIQIHKFISWIDTKPVYSEEVAPTFLTAYRQAMQSDEKCVIIKFHNVFKDLYMIVGKQ